MSTYVLLPGRKKSKDSFLKYVQGLGSALVVSVSVGLALNGD